MPDTASETTAPTIYLDADAAPRAVKEVLFRAAQRRGVPVVVVANSWMQVPRLKAITFIQVAAGADVADDYIAEKATSGDLVITQDVPLAARVVPKGAAVIQPNGRELDERSVTQALNMRDFKESLRESGTMTGGPPPYGDKQKQKFSNALDRWITRSA